MTKLYEAPTKNYVTTSLNGAIGTGDTTITLSSTSNMQSPGYVVVDREDGSGTATPSAREVISYTGISGSDLTGCTRGADNSTARTHSDGALVETMLTVGMWGDLIDAFDAEHTDAGAHQTDTISEKTGGSGVTIDGVECKDGGVTLTGDFTVADAKDIKFNSGAKIERSSGHIVITPESDKFVKTAVLRQDNVTDGYDNNTVILSGWGYMEGNDGSSIQETVTFGITFSAAPVVVITGLGFDSDTPSAITSFDERIGAFSSVDQITTTDFEAKVTHRDANGNLESGKYYGYSWIAIGQLN